MLSVVLCYLEMCFSAATGTCLIPGQVPRCKGSCSVYVVGLLLLLLLGLLKSNLFSLSFQLPLVYQDQMGLRNGTTRSTGLQENKLEKLLFVAKAWVVAGTKPLLKQSLLKPDLHAVLELGVGCYVWSSALVSAGDAAGAV